MSTASLAFTLHGKLTSANAIKRPTAIGRLVKTQEAKEDAARIRELATTATEIAHWQIPHAASMEIVMWNSRLDVGNAEKCLADAIKGIVLRDDRDLVRLVVEKRKDRGGERYDVTVSPAQPLTAKGKDLNAPIRVPRRHLPKTILAEMQPRSLKQLRSGDRLSFQERDRLLAELEK